MTTTTLDYSPGTRAAWRPRLSARHIPVAATVLVWLLLVLAAAMTYKHIFSWGVFMDLLRTNAALGVAAVGMTFVILSGGIDLSVGAVVGFTGILIASLTVRHGWPAPLSIALALALGTALGAGMGAVISFFSLPPFLVTLAGMFLMRGLALSTSLDSVQLERGFYGWVVDFSGRAFPMTTLIFLATLAVAAFIAHQTRFGRDVYAIGGSETSANLMGVSVASTKIRIYAISGLCAALAGVLYTFNKSAGNATDGVGLELDAIAAVVIGGTPLAGGVGYVLGTLVGVLILGTINTILDFDGRLNPWWARIAIGVLLLAFILLQKLVQARVGRRRAPVAQS